MSQKFEYCRKRPISYHDVNVINDEHSLHVAFHWYCWRHQRTTPNLMYAHNSIQNNTEKSCKISPIRSKNSWMIQIVLTFNRWISSAVSPIDTEFTDFIVGCCGGTGFDRLALELCPDDITGLFKLRSLLLCKASLPTPPEDDVVAKSPCNGLPDMSCNVRIRGRCELSSELGDNLANGVLWWRVPLPTDWPACGGMRGNGLAWCGECLCSCCWAAFSLWWEYDDTGGGVTLYFRALLASR